MSRKDAIRLANEQEAIRLANAHWEYTETILRIEIEHSLTLSGQLYRDAFVHGYKHGQEVAERSPIK